MVEYLPHRCCARVVDDACTGGVGCGGGVHYAGVVDRLQYFVERRVDDAAGESATARFFFEYWEYDVGGGLGDYRHAEWLCADVIWLHTTSDLGRAGICAVGFGHLVVRTG